MLSCQNVLYTNNTYYFSSFGNIYHLVFFCLFSYFKHWNRCYAKCGVCNKKSILSTFWAFYHSIHRKSINSPFSKMNGWILSSNNPINPNKIRIKPRYAIHVPQIKSPYIKASNLNHLSPSEQKNAIFALQLN